MKFKVRLNIFQMSWFSLFEFNKTELWIYYFILSSLTFSLVYKKDKFPSGYPSFVYGDGDGTVNKRSLEGCLFWKNYQKEPVYHQTFSKVDHMNILSDNRILQYITTVLPKLI